LVQVRTLTRTRLAQNTNAIVIRKKYGKLSHDNLPHNNKKQVLRKSQANFTSAWNWLAVLALMMEKRHGNQLKASEMPGLNRNTVRKLLKQYQIDPGYFRD
jgi:transcriptional regulator with AAA-type ATPase domain